YGWLPEAHSDFIFAIVGEETGLIGTTLVMLGFLVFGIRGYRASLRAPDRFGMALAASITTWVTFEAFLNMATVTNTLPITGVPLPFFSYGGTALATTLAAVGLLLSIARRGSGSALRNNRQSDETFDRGRRNRRTPVSGAGASLLRGRRGHGVHTAAWNREPLARRSRGADRGSSARRLHAAHTRRAAAQAARDRRKPGRAQAEPCGVVGPGQAVREIRRGGSCRGPARRGGDRRACARRVHRGCLRRRYAEADGSRRPDRQSRRRRNHRRGGGGRSAHGLDPRHVWRRAPGGERGRDGRRRGRCQHRRWRP